MQHQPW